MLVKTEEWYEPLDRCALCGRAVRHANNGEGPLTYCRGCGIEFPPVVAGYDRWQDWVTPDGHYQFQYAERRVWDRWDLWAASVSSVNEIDLPGTLIQGEEWRAAQTRQARIAGLYGAVEQLALPLSG